MTTEKKRLNEAKVLIVGQAEVGKTSLVEQLTEGTFDPNRPKTEGIGLKPWRVDIDGTEIQLNIWDFGGQEIMHATHQFFFTQRSLYLLVLNSRLDETENRLHYWLSMVETFGGDSPIIIVCNKSDEHPFDYDWLSLQEKYGTIQAIIPRVSCKTGEGIARLKQTITAEIAKLEHVGDELLTTWFDVKKELEEMDKDYIPYDTYLEMCRNQGIEDIADQARLIQLLHELGVVLYFHGHPLLEDTNVLNPEWVTQGIYKILNDRDLSVEGRGVLTRDDLDRILDDTVKYPPLKHKFLVGMMQKFQLCFGLPKSANVPDERFLIPDILSRSMPARGRNTDHWSDALNFQYHYGFLPSSVISRFIVQMHERIYEDAYWRDGVILISADEKNEALVRADSEAQKIFISVKGEANTGRTFLKTIRNRFDSIHATMPKIEAKEKVPLPEHSDIVVDYQHLLTLEELGENTFVPPGLAESVNVRQLLYRIDPIRADKLENDAKTFAKRVLWGIGGAFVGISILLLIMIPLFGWEVIEQWTYVFGAIVGIVGVFVYLPLALQAKEPSLQGVYEHIVEWRKNRLLHKL